MTDDIDIYYATRTSNEREWRFVINFVDGSSIRIYAAVRSWDWYPIIEVIEKVIDFHGIYDEHIAGMRFHRYHGGTRVI